MAERWPLEPQEERITIEYPQLTYSELRDTRDGVAIGYLDKNENWRTYNRHHWSDVTFDLDADE